MFIFLGIFWRSLEIERQLQSSIEIAAQLTYDFAQTESGAAVDQFLRLSNDCRKLVSRITCGCLAFVASADVRFPFPNTGISMQTAAR